MESASSQNRRLYGLVPALSGGYPRWTIAVIATCLATAALIRAQLTASQSALILLAVCCFVWWFQLASRSGSALWSAVLATLLGSQLMAALLHAPPRPAAARSGALASAVIVYLMLWAFSVLQTRRALQGVAGMAFLLPLSAFVHPTVMVAAAFLGVVFMAACRCRFGGYHASALLTFTPAALCVGVLFALHWMGITVVENPTLHLNLAPFRSWFHLPLNWVNPDWMIPPLAFAIGVVLLRMLDGQTASLDFVYMSLLILLVGAVVLAPVTFSDASLTDLCMIVYAGAMSLMTPLPPRRFLSRALVLVLVFVGAAAPWIKLAA